MKVLHIGVFNQPYCSDIYRQNGFIQAGFKSRTIDFRQIRKADYKAHIDIHLNAFEPDLVFVNKGEFFTSDDLAYWREGDKAKWVLFYGDFLTRMPADYERMKQFDALLIKTDDLKIHQTYLDKGVKKVFYHNVATDVDYFYKYPSGENCDVAWIGNLQPNFPLSNLRKAMLERVVNLPVIMHLYGASRALDNVGTWKGTVYNTDFAIAASKAKILLGINSHDDIMLSTSNRLFNSMACGFTLYKKFKGIDRLFTNHKDLVWWETLDEMEAQLKYYFKHPKERQIIYHQGRYTISKHHTYKHRALELYQIYREL